MENSIGSHGWPEVEEILKRSPTVEGTAVFEYLCRQQEGAFQQGQLRTLQRQAVEGRIRRSEGGDVPSIDRDIKPNRTLRLWDAWE